MSRLVSRVKSRSGLRRGAAAVELALLSPVILLMFVIVVDYGRVFYYSQIVEAGARAGAMYASDPHTASISPYKNVDSAVVAEARVLNPAPTVTSSSGTDAAGNQYVTVQVSWTFNTIVQFPGVPATKVITRSVQMRLVPP